MKKEEVPAARVIRLADEMAKYKPTTDVLGGDGSEMKTFVNDFLDGKLKVSSHAELESSSQTFNTNTYKE
jgi:hypothetical protein